MAARKATSKAQNPSLTGGPQTEAGKIAVVQNLPPSIHGLSGRAVRWKAEELESIQTAYASMETAYRPQGAAEKHCLRQLAIQFQRQARLEQYLGLVADRARLQEILSEFISSPIEYSGFMTTPRVPTDAEIPMIARAMADRDEVDRSINFITSDLSDTAEKIQGAINRQIKINVTLLKELQMLRFLTQKD